MKKITVYIDDKKIEANPGVTILQAANMEGINIPTLCHREDLITKGNCRVCIVEIEGAPRLEPACSTYIADGMKINTKSEKVLAARRSIIELLLSNHNRNCPGCEKNKACELQKIADEMNILVETFEAVYEPIPKVICNSLMVMEMDKCIKCKRCVDACTATMTTGTLAMANRSCDTRVMCAFGDDINDTKCIKCGKCIEVCPVGALSANKHIFSFWNAIDDKSKYVVAYMMPGEKIELGKTYGYDETKIPPTGTLLKFLEIIGVNKVLDASTACTEAEALRQEELKKDNQCLPVIRTDDPGFIRFVHNFYPDLVKNLSDVKPALNLMGYCIKRYFANKLGIEPQDVVTVAITKILSYKAEADKEPGDKDIDIILTPDEVPLLIKQTMYNLSDIGSKDFDTEIIFDTTGRLAKNDAVKTIKVGSYDEARKLFCRLSGKVTEALAIDFDLI